LGRGAGREHVVHQREVSTRDSGFGHEGEGVAQVFSASFGIEILLCVGVLRPQQQSFVARNMQSFTEPARQHRCLIEPSFAQASGGQRHRDQGIRSWQLIVEAMLQGLSEKFAEQVAKRPFSVVFEASNQTVDREAV
jgi:hypothetical protein